MILGGSTNAVLHLIAIAHSVGINLTIDDFQSVSDRVPFIADLKPSGKYVMEDVYKIGGIPGTSFPSTIQTTFLGDSFFPSAGNYIPFSWVWFLDLSAFVSVVGQFCFSLSDCYSVLCLIRPVDILPSGIALSAQEQTYRRKHTHRYRENAGRKP